jgi:hypothetical protein
MDPMPAAPCPPPAAGTLYDASRGVYYVKPVLRGWLHLLWFGASLVAGVTAESIEVAVVVVLVADHDRVQVRQLLRLEGDRLALVVEGALGEPGVGEHGHAADLDQVAAVGDPVMTTGSVMTVPLLRRQWPSKRASSPVARVSEVGSAQRSALRGDDPVADTPATVVASQGVKVRHACERPVRHEHEALGPRGYQAVLLAGDDDVRHVMSDGVPRAELQGGAPDRLDPFKGSYSRGAHVVDDVRREDLPEPVQVASVEYVSVQRQDLANCPAIFSVQLACHYVLRSFWYLVP